MELQRLKNNLSELLSESTAYGLPKIFKSKRMFFKIFWLIYFLLGTIFCIYFTRKTIDNYYQYEVVSQRATIFPISMPFPAISICSMTFTDFTNKSLGQVMKSCWFAGLKVNNPEEYFEKKGDCFTFNNGINMKDEIVPILNAPVNEGAFFAEFQNKNILVYISEPSTAPLFDGIFMKNYNFHIQSSYINVKIARTEENKLGLPYNQCYKDANEFPMNKTIIDYIKTKNVAYKQRYCFKLCTELKYIINASNPCNCPKNITLGTVRKKCYKDEKLQEVNNCIDKFLTEIQRDSKEKCQEYCPLECDSVIFSHTIIMNLKNDDNISSFSIGYDEIKYTLYSEIPKTEPFGFISEIGGTLGLFIGCSFITLFEIGELLLEIFIILCRRKNQNKFNSKIVNENRF